MLCIATDQTLSARHTKGSKPKEVSPNEADVPVKSVCGVEKVKP